MPVHVQERPFCDTQQHVSILGVNVVIFAYEPVVYVSLTRPDIAVLPPDAPKFLAIADTGNTVAFNIREDHLKAWTGLAAADLPLRPGPAARIHDASGTVASLPRRLAKVWLHPFPDDARLGPRDLQVAGGILVYETPKAQQSAPASPQPTGPHLPLLGARAFFPTNLAVFVDYKRLRVTIGDEDRLP